MRAMGGSRLLLPGLLLIVLVIPGSAEEGSGEVQETDAPMQSTMDKHLVYGNLNQEVKVYVKIYQESAFLVCMDEKLADREVMDPFFLWLGPDGRNVKGHSFANLTITGKLSLKSFTKDMSGPYTCTLSYTSFDSKDLHEKEKFKAFKFLVLAYRDPDFTYQISVRYSVEQCDAPGNDKFFEQLKFTLEDLIFGLTCQLMDTYYKCHMVKSPHHGLQPQIFITFKLSPFGAGWEAVCRQLTHDCEDETNNRVLKAKGRIEKYFLMQAIHKNESETFSGIKYLDNSLAITTLERCRPGFGKNESVHSDCIACCVVCNPGTYSSDNSALCKICKGIRINYYGATAC